MTLDYAFQQYDGKSATTENYKRNVGQIEIKLQFTMTKNYDKNAPLRRVHMDSMTTSTAGEDENPPHRMSLQPVRQTR